MSVEHGRIRCRLMWRGCLCAPQWPARPRWRFRLRDFRRRRGQAHRVRSNNQAEAGYPFSSKGRAPYQAAARQVRPFVDATRPTLGAARRVGRRVPPGIDIPVSATDVGSSRLGRTPQLSRYRRFALSPTAYVGFGNEKPSSHCGEAGAKRSAGLESVPIEEGLGLWGHLGRSGRSGKLVWDHRSCHRRFARRVTTAGTILPCPGHALIPRVPLAGRKERVFCCVKRERLTVSGGARVGRGGFATANPYI
jgi:hypothetical protein